MTQEIHTIDFDEKIWVCTCHSIARTAANNAGGAEDIYVGNLSFQVDQAVATLPEQHRSSAIELARITIGYESPAQLKQRQSDSLAAGYCRHGYGLDYCPLGCGDL